MCETTYEMSDPYTVGGATGVYLIPSPYHTECEWVLISGVYVGTMASQGTFVVMSKNPNPPTLSSTGANVFGLSGNIDSNPLEAYVGSLTSQASFVTFDTSNWMPLASPTNVYAQVTAAASSGVLITVRFRRSLDRVIPEKPRQKPHTHAQQQPGRREHRRMSAGFAAQYPEEGQAYQHIALPPQDTAVAKRGGLPLGPTDITHRGVGKRGR